MGSPYVWYKVALKYFAYMLSDDVDNFDFFQNMSKEELEARITERRSQISENKFYYYAGMATEKACSDAYECGCDALNASICGLMQFEEFIGLEGE